MSKSPLVFTGAGISVGSGLPTFAEAMWRGRPMRDFLDINYLDSDLPGFLELYREAFVPWMKAAPSRAHSLIAEAGYPVVTQNIDQLHQQAGSGTVVELHGDIYGFLCRSCGERHDVRKHPHILATPVPHCLSCGNNIRPNIVLFGEGIYHFETALAMVEEASRLIVVGTSLSVYPALLIERAARHKGLRVDIINEDADSNIARFL